MGIPYDGPIPPSDASPSVGKLALQTAGHTRRKELADEEGSSTNDDPDDE